MKSSNELVGAQGFLSPEKGLGNVGFREGATRFTGVGEWNWIGPVELNGRKMRNVLFPPKETMEYDRDAPDCPLTYQKEHVTPDSKRDNTITVNTARFHQLTHCIQDRISECKRVLSNVKGRKSVNS